MARRRKSALVKGDPARGIGYLRVSTEEQSLGPEAQRVAIEAWADREKIAIVAWEQDLGVSGGAELADRPGLERAIAGLREHNAGAFVVAKRDRLARDVAKAREIMMLVGMAGGVVRSADGTSDNDGPEGVLLQGLQDLFAEYERLLIRTRTKAALDRKRARGEAVGRAPFGYRIGPGTRLVEHPGEQEVIREIVRLKRADAPEREIAEELARRGYTSRSGKPLLQTQVHRIIARMPATTWTEADCTPQSTALLEGSSTRSRSQDTVTATSSSAGTPSRDEAPGEYASTANGASDDWGAFRAFVEARVPGRDPLDASPQAVGVYLRHLRRRGAAPERIRRAARRLVDRLTGAGRHPEDWSGGVPVEVTRELI